MSSFRGGPLSYSHPVDSLPGTDIYVQGHFLSVCWMNKFLKVKHSYKLCSKRTVDDGLGNLRSSIY